MKKQPTCRDAQSKPVPAQFRLKTRSLTLQCGHSGVTVPHEDFVSKITPCVTHSWSHPQRYRCAHRSRGPPAEGTRIHSAWNLGSKYNTLDTEDRDALSCRMAISIPCWRKLPAKTPDTGLYA